MSKWVARLWCSWILLSASPVLAEGARSARARTARAREFAAAAGSSTASREVLSPRRIPTHRATRPERRPLVRIRSRGAVAGQHVAQEMARDGVQRGVFKELATRLSRRRLTQRDAVDAIYAFLDKWRNGVLGAYPVGQGESGWLIVPSVRYANVPVLGISPQGEVVLGSVPLVEVRTDATGTVHSEFTGEFRWER